MSEIDKIKKEARMLLDEVNYSFERRTPARFESVSETSFRDRLKELKQKVVSLQINSASLASCLHK